MEESKKRKEPSQEESSHAQAKNDQVSSPIQHSKSGLSKEPTLFLEVEEGTGAQAEQLAWFLVSGSSRRILHPTFLEASTETQPRISGRFVSPSEVYGVVPDVIKLGPTKDYRKESYEPYKKKKEDYKESPEYEMEESKKRKEPSQEDSHAQAKNDQVCSPIQHSKSELSKEPTLILEVEEGTGAQAEQLVWFLVSGSSRRILHPTFLEASTETKPRISGRFVRPSEAYGVVPDVIKLGPTKDYRKESNDRYKKKKEKYKGIKILG